MPGLTREKTLVTQVAQCTICNPVEVLVLMLYFDLPREEHLLPMYQEEIQKRFRCLSFTRIVRPTASLRVAKAKIVVFEQNCVLSDKTNLPADFLVSYSSPLIPNPSMQSLLKHIPHGLAGLQRPALSHH